MKNQKKQLSLLLIDNAAHLSSEDSIFGLVGAGMFMLGVIIYSVSLGKW